MKTTVIYHRADFDGLFCREIARKFLPDAELIGWDYGDPLIPMPSGAIYILDLSPECVEGLTACGGFVHPEAQRLIWIDHHKSAIDKFGNNCPGYRIDGVAACRLAWQWFATIEQHKDEDLAENWKKLPDKLAFVARNVTEPLAVRLAGEYDIWDKRDERVDIFQFGLRSRELTDSDWSELLSPNRKLDAREMGGLVDVGHEATLAPDGTTPPAIIWQLLDAGKTLQRYQEANDKGMMQRSFMVMFEGLRFLCLNVARCNSLTFASKDVPSTNHDALMGFYWTGLEWSVSLYHANDRKDLNLSTIAVKYGGGGHRGACGFRTKTLPFVA